MIQLTREARQLVEGVRAASEPSEADRVRVRAALLARVGIPETAAKGGRGAEGAPGSAPRAWGAALWGGGALAGLVLVLGGILIGRAEPAGHEASSLDVRPMASPAPSSSFVPESVPSTAPEPVASSDRAPPLEPPPASPIAHEGAKKGGAKVQRVSPPSEKTTSLAVEDEVALLTKAHTARQAGDARAALVALEEHARRFPRGVLADERTVERVLALCALGRVDEARAEGDRFLRLRPGSALGPRVRASCAGSASETERAP